MYRIGNEEIEELTQVIQARNLFKVNKGVQESRQVEEKLCRILNSPYAIFMTSGHAALSSALIAMGIGPGDEVIVPGYTYIATAMAVLASGAIPVITEIDETLTISPEDIEKKITKHTKGIVPVHIQGFPSNMDAIMQLAKKYGLLVLEDACQSDGGSFQGKRLGTIGDAGALSFNYFKVISCGEGGTLLTDNREIYERALIYHDSSAVAFFGNQLEGFTTEPFCGSEYRSNELCAAVLNRQLDKLDGILADLRKNKAYMMQRLQDVCEFIPSNDLAGDCGTTLAIRFESEAQARRFATAEGIRGVLPIDTGKHVYSNWTAVMKKRGALHPAMDPFKMEANKDIVPDYRADMCPRTLELLSRVVYLDVDPNATCEQLDQRLDLIRKALQA